MVYFKVDQKLKVGKNKNDKSWSKTKFIDKLSRTLI